MMTTKWFCKAALRLATSLAGSVLLLAVVHAVAPNAQAAVPAWLQQAAAQSLPAYPADTNAVILYDEQIITVHDNGEIVTTRRRAYKILTAKGADQVKILRVPFDPETKISGLHAWGLPSGGGKEFEAKDKDAAEVAITENFYDEERDKILEIPGAVPGNVIGYEIEQKERPYIFSETWWAQHRYPVVRARLSLELPPGWEYDAKWVNYAGQAPAAQGTATWEVQNLPGIESEEDMPPWHAIAARLLLNLYPAKDELKARAHGSWNRIGAWYTTLTNGRLDTSPDITAKVAALTQEAPDPVSKIRRITKYVQQDVRYVAIEIGIGGYQPHPASQVFTNKYGDCKDKATLLIAMLKQAGIDAYYLLVDTERGVVMPDVPSAEFNHMTVAIKLPAGVTDGTFNSVVADKELGKLLIFDPTDEYTPLGMLPASEQESHGLLVEGGTGELIDLPLISPDANQLSRSGQLQLLPDGGLTGTVQEIRSGYMARYRRGEFLNTSAPDRRKVVENYLAVFLNNFELRSATLGNLNAYDQPLVLTMTFQSPGYAKTVGNMVLVRPRVLGQKANMILEGKQRKYPLEFEAASLETDHYELQVPPGLVVDELPPPTHLDCGYAEYESKTEFSGNSLKYTRSYSVKKVLVPQEDLAKVKKFFRQVAADEENTVVFKRSP